MIKKRLLALFSIVILIACNSPVTKKVLIMGRGKITVKDNKITMNEGSGYAEETIEIRGDKPDSWTVTTATGKTTINIPEEKGFYILNLKTDTIVGSQQNIGKDLRGRTMSQEELKLNIDSLTKLTKGTNVSPGSHNFFILPNQLIKVSPNIEAKVFGPFIKIPGTIEVDKNGNAPEIYKFYTNSEMRDLITTLKKMTY